MKNILITVLFGISGSVVAFILVAANRAGAAKLSLEGQVDLAVMTLSTGFVIGMLAGIALCFYLNRRIHKKRVVEETKLESKSDSTSHLPSRLMVLTGVLLCLISGIAITKFAQGSRELIPDHKIEIVVNSIGMELVKIPNGEFFMGTQHADTQKLGDSIEDEVRHKVTITKNFYMGAFEVTKSQYEQVMGERRQFNNTGGDLPADLIKWDMAREFCHRLSELESEKAAGRSYRLPTEAEWEYACRAGTDTIFFWGNDAEQLGEYAWCDGNSKYETHSVGQKKPNSWGLYDMYGNVHEWCSDWYDEYPTFDVIDPSNDEGHAKYRVIRGGNWSANPEFCRSAARGSAAPDYYGSRFGFRVVMVQNQTK